MNVVAPGFLPMKKIYRGGLKFKRGENISAFLRAARALGVQDHSSFTTVALIEQKDLHSVVNCIIAFGKAVYERGEWDGPQLTERTKKGAKKNWGKALGAARTANAFGKPKSSGLWENNYGLGLFGGGSSSTMARNAMGDSSHPTHQKNTRRVEGYTGGNDKPVLILQRTFVD